MRSSRDVTVICSPRDSLRRYVHDKLMTDDVERPPRTCETKSCQSSGDSESGSRVKSSSLSTEFDPPRPLSRELIQQLERSRTTTEKRAALDEILRCQCECAHAGHLLRTLQESLNDDDEQVFELSLEIHRRFLRSSWESLKDAFVNLLETMYVHFFQLDARHIVVAEYPYRNAFQMYRLVLNTLSEVLANVSGVGHSRLEKIIGNFVDLLFFTTKLNEPQLTPLHIVSTIDPRALWCEAMVHAATSREVLFKCVARNRNIVGCIFLVVSDWMCDPFAAKCKALSPTTVRYATFVSCLRCCAHLSAYKSFYRLFPVVVQSKFVVSLNSFTTLLVSFVKSARSKAVSERVIASMLDCCVHLLQHQPADALALQLQCILEMCNGKYSRKYLLEMVRRVLQNRVTLNRTMNCVMYAKSRVNANGKLLRPRLYSAASNNVFVCLMNTITRALRGDNQSTIVPALGICKNVLQTHEFYLICGPDGYLMSEFVQVLATKCKMHKGAGNSAFSRFVRDEDFAFAIGSTPLGFYFLASTQSLNRSAVMKMEHLETSWLFTPWKNMVPFIVGSEFQMNLNGVYKKMTSDILALIQEMIECDCNNEMKSSQYSDKILIFVDSFSNSVAGMRSLMTQTSPKEHFDLKNFAEFIETYALQLTYEYKMQHTALQALQIMSTNINLKLFLLRQYNYEDLLLEIQDKCISSTGKLIKDECSLLRTELLHSHTYNDDYRLYTGRVKSAPKVKLSRRKLSEIEKFLQKTKHGPFDNNWLKYARKFYKLSLSANMKTSVTLELIEKVCKSVTRSVRVGSIATMSSTDTPMLHAEEVLGIKLAVRYGIQNQLLPENWPNEENLLQVIKTVRAFIGYQDTENFDTFDTVLATFFIICGGSVEKTLHIVACVIPLPISTFIWPQVTPNNAKKKYLFGHLIEWLLYQEVPNVFAALLKYGISWWLVCQRKLDNCFWNTMTWVEIYHWLCLTLLNNPDNLIYYFTSIAFKNECKILQTTKEMELRNVLHTSFSSHRLEEHIIFMDYLSKKYHSYLSSFLMD